MDLAILVRIKEGQEVLPVEVFGFDHVFEAVISLGEPCDGESKQCVIVSDGPRRVSGLEVLFDFTAGEGTISALVSSLGGMITG
jgi:hypothetical protein